ncbi:MAG TPA: glycoside hydrolase family 43 protein [Chitinophagaceae bacterium]|nr:glycoside hydrolase family 43 protein [Chitinophagaceae bacterium]
MPKTIAVLFFLLLSYAARTQNETIYLFCYFKDNGQDGLHLAYSKDGLRFTALKHDSSFLAPTVSSDKLMRDPCIIRGADGLFHMVWTVSWNDKGIGYASSSDLIHWSEQQYIPVMAGEDLARNCWAPEITYDPKKKEYMIYWATTIEGRYPSDTAVEKGYNHRLYYTTTKNFKKFSKTKLLYNQGFNVIDASIVPDGQRYIMFLKDETRYPPQKNIRVATSDKLTEGFSFPSMPITGNYWAEGPSAIKIDNQWIVYFDKYRDHKYGAVTSSDLVKWEDISDKLRMPSGIKHGSVLTITKQELDVLMK